nr:MAG TPA: hypothetical protein [Caudoviricetes sp.]
MTTLSHTSNDLVQFVVFTPLFATLPPTHYIVHCGDYTISYIQ